MVGVLLISEMAKYCIIMAVCIAAVIGAVLLIRLTLKVPVLSHIIAVLFAIGMSVGFYFREKLFPLLFNIESYDTLVGFKEIEILWIYIGICTFLWFVYSGSASAMLEDEEGYYYLVWSSVDGKSNKWSAFGLLALIGAIVGAVLGILTAWITSGVWGGAVYALSGVQCLWHIILALSCLKHRRD